MKLVAPASGMTEANSFSRFSCLKHFFMHGGGSATHEATCAITGSKMVNATWVEGANQRSQYMSAQGGNYREHIPNGGHHNAHLNAGRWFWPSRKSSIWVVAGYFQEGDIFGFGDSVLSHEIVFNVAPTTGWVSLVLGGNATVPNLGASESLAVVDPNVFSLLGLVVNEEAQQFEFFMTDASGNYQFYTKPFSILPNFGGLRFPPTYSMGPDHTQSFGLGVKELSVAAVFAFEKLPSDYRTAMKWHRDDWARNKKSVYEPWASVAGATETASPPTMGVISRVVNSSSQITVSYTGSSHTSGILQHDILISGVSVTPTIFNNVTFPYVHSGLASLSHNYYVVRARSNEGPQGFTKMIYGRTL